MASLEYSCSSWRDFKALMILFALAVGAAYLRHRRASELLDLRFEEEDPEALTVFSL